MVPDTFDYVHSLIEDDIFKMDTNCRRAIGTEEKLAATLRLVLFNTLKNKAHESKEECHQEFSSSVVLPTNPPGQLHVFWPDGHPLGMDSTQLGVLEQADKVRLSCLLDALNCTSLKA
jgi:hypothetical protein